MVSLDLLKNLSRKTPSKIVVIVADGLGGLPGNIHCKTELEYANTPNLDQMATKGICGLADPVSPGITPGSGPGHLALFGYDPVINNIGRGVLEATGIDFKLRATDVAVRGNFCSLDEQGLITDRRSGRLPTETNIELCKKLSTIKIPGVEIFIETVKDHRLVVVFRGKGLSGNITNSDPGETGMEPVPATALDEKSTRTALIANSFLDQAKELLKNEKPANMVIFRGFAQPPKLPSLNEIYNLNPAAIAAYPMYRGLARLVGMSILTTGHTIKEEFETLQENYDKYDFFFLHVKGSDAAGEDGDFKRKVKVIEELDEALPTMLKLNPEVVMVTGDHSTPAKLKGHSWHPVPVLINSQWCRQDGVTTFSEKSCLAGGLCRIPSQNLMTLLMANALKLKKFGA